MPEPFQDGANVETREVVAFGHARFHMLAGVDDGGVVTAAEHVSDLDC
jgi:hypothetical protein